MRRHPESRLRMAGVPVGPVQDLRQAVEHPVAVERGIVVGDGITTLPLVRLPIDDGSTHFRPPPRLGEHTVDVLLQAGFTSTEIAELRPDAGNTRA